MKFRVLLLSVLALAALLACSNSGNADQAESEQANYALCDEDKLIMPPYLPFVKNEDIGKSLFFSVMPECQKDNFEVIVGLVPDCMGQNVCSHGSFSIHPISSSVRSEFTRVLSQSYKEVRLENMTYGYYVPSTCAAYCNESKLIWFKEGRMHTVGTKQFHNENTTLNELIKSSNSYILSQTGE